IDKIINTVAPYKRLRDEVMQVGLDLWIYSNLAEIDLFIEEINEKYGSIQELEKIAYQSESDEEYILLATVESAIAKKKKFLKALKKLKEIKNMKGATIDSTKIRDGITSIG
ncbi:MAG: hypothetical protein ACE5KT_10725, partial [Methanosarcinales archaeon]